MNRKKFTVDFKLKLNLKNTPIQCKKNIVLIKNIFIKFFHQLF